MHFKKLLTAVMTVSLIAWMAHSSVAATQHVSPKGNDANDGLSWATAKQTIQAGVDAAGYKGLVLVTDGTYNLDGPIVVSNAITVSSVNGAQHTVVNGNGDVTSNRVFYLNDGCVLQGFMVANGQFLEGDGGGVYCVSTNVLIDSCMIMYNGAKNGGGVYGGTLNSCFLLNNSAVNGAGSYGATLNACGLMYNTANGLGGGAYDCIMTDCGILDNAANQSGGGVWGGTLDRCAILKNMAITGGGACSGTLNNCVIEENTATDDGGASQATLNNCTVVKNAADNNVGGAADSTLNNCIVFNNEGINVAANCVARYTCAPDVPAGNGNITAAPMFVDDAGGNYKLALGSPCINAGNNNLLPADAASSDTGGSRRIYGGRVDIGAYECVIGPLLSINDLPGHKVRVRRTDPVTVTASMVNLPDAYIGIPVDWWLAAYVQNGGLWFYFDPNMNLIPFDINLANCRPVYQGPLANVPPQTLVKNLRLAPGVYQVWFAVDYPMDGALNLTPGYHLLDCVTLTVE